MQGGAGGSLWGLAWFNIIKPQETRPVFFKFGYLKFDGFVLGCFFNVWIVILIRNSFEVQNISCLLKLVLGFSENKAVDQDFNME